jgi:hypothetical protein
LEKTEIRRNKMKKRPAIKIGNRGQFTIYKQSAEQIEIYGRDEYACYFTEDCPIGIYDPEWEAGNLKEIFAFIDSYENKKTVYKVINKNRKAVD